MRTTFFIRMRTCWPKLAIFLLLAHRIPTKKVSWCNFLGFYTGGNIFAWLYFVQLLMKNQFINYHRMFSLHKCSHNCQNYCWVLEFFVKLVRNISIFVRLNRLISFSLKFVEHCSIISTSKILQMKVQFILRITL